MKMGLWRHLGLFNIKASYTCSIAVALLIRNAIMSQLPDLRASTGLTKNIHNPSYM